MERDELELWLCGPDTILLPPFAAAEALGLPADALADTTLLRTARRVRALQLTLAILRDAFAADLDVWRWLETPRRELCGMTPRAALVEGLHETVEGLAVETWNAQICLGSCVRKCLWSIESRALQHNSAGVACIPR